MLHSLWYRSHTFKTCRRKDTWINRIGIEVMYAEYSNVYFNYFQILIIGAFGTKAKSVEKAPLNNSFKSTFLAHVPTRSQ